MIVTFITVAWHILYFQTWCFPVQCLEGATDVHKYMPQMLDGLELSQWHPEVKHMRPCHCCLWGMVSHQHAFAAMPKNECKASSIRSSKRLHVTWNSWSHTLPGQMLQKERINSLRKGPVVSCCSLAHQSAYGMTALSWKPILGPLPSMRFIN